MNRPSQKSILSGLVRKRDASDTPDQTDGANGVSVQPKVPKLVETPTEVAAADATKAPVAMTQGALKCIGILPGIGKYTESSDSEKSTDTDDDYDCNETDWLGRKMKKGCGNE